MIADLTATTFCDAAGIRYLARARDQAAANGMDCGWPVPPGRVREVMNVLGLDVRLPLYESLQDARRAGHCRG